MDSYLSLIYKTDERRMFDALAEAQPEREPEADEPTAAQEEYAGRLIAESVASDQDRIDTAYWRLRSAMCDKVPGGDALWRAAKLVEQLKRENSAFFKNAGHPYHKGKVDAYTILSDYLATTFERLYGEAQT